jgi:Zn-dependent protease
VRIPRVRLLSYRAVPFRIDPMWLPAAVLVSWSLAAVVFPAWRPGHGRASYWAMGIGAVVVLFASVLTRELSHVGVAARRGVPMYGVTLFLLGGVAELGTDPPDAAAEWHVSAAGVLTSIGIAVLALAAAPHAAPESVAAVLLRSVAAINLLLAAVNAIPAFPLDGGRVARALLWRRDRDVLRANRDAARVGIAVGVLLVGAGVWRLAVGDRLGGAWLCFLGLVLARAADTGRQQLVIRQALAAEPVRHVMTEGPVTVPAGTTLACLVDEYIYRHHHQLFPVQDNGRLLGAISTREVRRVPRAEWLSRRVGTLAVPLSPINTVTPDTSALEALARMQGSGRSRLLVVEGGRLAGVVTVQDVLGFLRRYGYETRAG